MNKNILLTLIIGIKSITDRDSKKFMGKNITHHLKKMSTKEVEEFLENLKNDDEAKKIIISNWHANFYYIFNYCSQNNFYCGLRENLIQRRNEILQNYIGFYRVMRRTMNLEVWQIVISANVIKNTILKRAAILMNNEIANLFANKKR